MKSDALIENTPWLQDEAPIPWLTGDEEIDIVGEETMIRGRLPGGAVYSARVGPATTHDVLCEIEVPPRALHVHSGWKGATCGLPLKHDCPHVALWNGPLKRGVVKSLSIHRPRVVK